MQQRIADILSAYDDLIENNRRRMALLEEAARQLYREWFVRLRFPGHEHTRITNGVPEGWERSRSASATECSAGLDGKAHEGDEDCVDVPISSPIVRHRVAIRRHARASRSQPAPAIVVRSHSGNVWQRGYFGRLKRTDWPYRHGLSASTPKRVTHLCALLLAPAHATSSDTDDRGAGG